MTGESGNKVEILRNPENGALKVEALGQFSPVAMHAALAPYYEKAPRGSHLFIIIDLSGLDAEPDQKEFTDMLIELGKEFPKAPALVAVVAQNLLGFAQGRLVLPYYSNVPLKLQVFKDEASATKWLMAGLE